MKLSNTLLMVWTGIVMWGCTQSTAESNKGTRNKKIAYEANWESLERHQRVPEWFADAKFGIYFHWGIYSVPAYGSEWYPYYLYRHEGYKDFHEKKYGSLSKFNYHDFIPMFRAENFDPEEWADLFMNAGARFAGPVAQHHDGFAMWDSKVNPWNVGKMGPKRDITGELLSSLKKRNLKTITTFHHARLRQRHEGDSSRWNTYNSHYAYHPNFITSTQDKKLARFYGNMSQKEFDQYWLDQVNEVVDKYSPDILWYDTWLNFIPENKIQEMAAYYFNHAQKNDQDVMLAYKQTDMPKRIGVLDIEQGGKKDLSETVWMTDITLSDKGSWCYTEGQKYKDAPMVIRNMIDVWSKNGVVLLNISPEANGNINTEQRKVLGQIGEWLDKYGESVYGTVPYYINGYGSAKTVDGNHGGQSAKVQYTANDIRFTMAKDQSAVYVFVLGKPKAGEIIRLKKLGPVAYAPPSPVKRVIDLGTGNEVTWTSDDHGFKITTPGIGTNWIANVYKMELK